MFVSGEHLQEIGRWEGERFQIISPFPSLPWKSSVTVTVSSLKYQLPLCWLANVSAFVGFPEPLLLVILPPPSLGMVVASWCTSLGCLTVPWAFTSLVTYVMNSLHYSLSVLNTSVVSVTWLDSDEIMLLNHLTFYFTKRMLWIFDCLELTNWILTVTIIIITSNLSIITLCVSFNTLMLFPLITTVSLCLIILLLWLLNLLFPLLSPH